MVSKCANPSCGAVFRYWHKGKLFRVEIGPLHAKTPSDGNRGPRRTEFFWLCDDCAARMTLEYHREEGMILKPLEPPFRKAS